MPISPPRHGAARVKAKRKATQKYYDKTKRVNVESYTSLQWRKLRAWYVKQHPLCIECKALGKANPVDVVDHIIELKDGGAPLDSSNLQSLCHYHHNSKTARERATRN